jgi:hypothetical protein
MFHLWVGITILSAVLGRKVSFDRGYYTLFPNFFTVLVAGSARCRKSTAIGIGIDLLKSLDTVRVLSGKTSPERFLGDIQVKGDDASVKVVKNLEVPPTLVHADELSVFLTKDSQGDKLIDLLTKLFDCPKLFDYKTWAHGVISLRDVFITILAGTTPEGAAKSMPDTAFGGGFASRIMFIYQRDTDRRNALPELTLEEIEMKEELIGGLLQIGRLRGDFCLTNEAKGYYIDWYDHMDFPEDKRMEGYYGRKHDHVLCLAMILSAAQMEHPKVTSNHVEAAIMALDSMEKQMPYALAQVGTADVRVHMERVIRQLQKFKRITHSELLKKNWSYMPSKDFRELMSTLITGGHVVRDQDNHSIYIWNGPMPGEEET